VVRRTFGCTLIALLLWATDLGAQFRPGGPVRIVLLVDSSAAVSAMLTPFRAALKVFLDELPGDPEIAFITTGGQFRMRVPPTSDRQPLREAAASFTADGGGNSLLLTMIEADDRLLKSAGGRRGAFVIITTDRGDFRGDERVDRYNSFAREFRARGGRAHAVVIRQARAGVTSQIVEHLTENTGGYFDAITIASALPKVMGTLTEYVAADQ
jgi:hypothetical protein